MRSLIALLSLLLLTAVAEQQPAVPVPDGGADNGVTPPPRFDDPWEAYDAAVYDQALAGFVDARLERPEDPALALNIGSTHYKMRDFPEAERSFAAAALAPDPELRQSALYNLGNVAYRQGRLEEAIERYKASLELDPEDIDAKVNLEFVRDEIRRRQEEAQKRQQEQQPSGEDGQPEDGEPQQNQEQQDGSEPQQPDGAEEPQVAPEEADGDGDGLSDRVEREGENPTDPGNPDTDGDGLADGEEDRDRDGALDPGETDPNRADTDGDGEPDGAEAGAAGAPPAEGAVGEEEPPPGMSQEVAQRFLDALEEGRPRQRRPGRRGKPAKDW